MSILSMIIAISAIIMIAGFVSLVRAVKRSVRGHEGLSGFIEGVEVPAESLHSPVVVSLPVSTAPRSDLPRFSKKPKRPTPRVKRQTATPFGLSPNK